MRLSIYVAAGAATCIAAAASADVVKQTFELKMNGGFYFPDTTAGAYWRTTFGMNGGYFGRTTTESNNPRLTYNTYTGPASDLTQVVVNLRMHIDDVSAARKFGTRLSIFTGVEPSPYYQHDSVSLNSTTNATGDWVTSWTFTGTALDVWRNPTASTGTVLAEVASSNWWGTGTMTIDITFTPSPAGLAIFALGGLARRRRAA
jgi:opacity protein-like surface antigen